MLLDIFEDACYCGIGYFLADVAEFMTIDRRSIVGRRGDADAKSAVLELNMFYERMWRNWQTRWI